MATDKSIDSNLIVLYDRWPGVATPNQDVPLGGFTGATHHNVATAAYPVGTKIQVYNTGVTAGIAGFATFIYLQIDITGTPTVAVKQVVVPDSATTWYTVTNDPDANINIPGGLAAIALGAMASDAYYGWFWCGGVCPEEFVSTLGGNYAGDGGAPAGAFIAKNLSADAIGFGVPAAATDVPMGYSLLADA